MTAVIVLVRIGLANRTNNWYIMNQISGYKHIEIEKREANIYHLSGVFKASFVYFLNCQIA